MSRTILLLLLSVLTFHMFGQTDVPGCTISVACNFDPAATVNDGSCDFVSCYSLGCTDPTACNFDPAAAINDGTCDYLSCLVSGCMNTLACNYDASAETSDGSCEFTSCAGCMDPNAPNYDITATIDDGSCEAILGCLAPEACNYNPDATQDDGSCDYTSCLVLGCVEATACNYDSTADISDGTCTYAAEGYNCAGECLIDTDGDGVCDQFEIFGCDDPLATNYSTLVTENDGSCTYPIPGCIDFEACNFDPAADIDDGSCEFTSCAGCTHPDACNYDINAIYSSDTCIYPSFGYDCDGNCLVDTDGDGVCDPFEIVGCQDVTACNFNELATDPGSCSFPLTNYDCLGNDLRPIFTNAPADVTVQGWNVPVLEEAVVEAIVSPFAAAYESQYLGNDCYSTNTTPTILTLTEVRIDGNCIHDYTLFRSWSAVDCAGYSSIHYQTITVVDVVPPTLELPVDMTVSCEDVAGTFFGNAASTDDCGNSTIEVVESIVAGACQGSYEIHRTFTATDPCLNTTTGTQVITVVDDIAPAITLPADFTVECSDNITLLPASATDNCGYHTISLIEQTLPGTSIGNYTIARIFTATDDCGNSSLATQIITVVDTTAPDLVVPSDYTVECSSTITYDAAYTSDNCGTVELTLVEETIPGNASGNYTIVRTFTSTDDAGNATSLAQTITVVDTTAPVLSTPADYTAECSDAIALDDATATDNCGTVSVSVVDVNTAGSSAGSYLIERTFTATDDAGNSSTSVQVITVIDTTAPVLSIPSDYTVECSDVITYDDATAVDNCGSSSVSVSEQTIAGNAIGNYTIVRTFSAIDDAGNSSSATQTISVQDTTAPVISGTPADLTAECSSVPAAADVTASDNCGTASVSLDEVSAPGACDGEYTLTRTWTATDDAGNASTSTQTINVVDTTAPEFAALADLALSCSDAISLPEPTLLGGCSAESFTTDESTILGDCAQSYSIVRTFTATDACGNTTTLIHTTSITDENAPTVVSGPCFGLSCATTVNELLGETLPIADITITDDCDAAATWSSIDAPASAADALALNLAVDQTATARTFTLIDECGNSVSYVQFIVTTFAIEGCTDSAACNYNGDANTENGSCDFCSCGINLCGCMDDTACNYDASAAYDDGSCEYAQPWYDCDGVCLDTNGNGLCDINEIGCMDSAACNYDPTALVDDGTCDYCNCPAPTFTSSIPGYGIEIELVTTHEFGALAGQSTYRLYITTPNTTDVITSVTGNDEFPLSLATTTSFYQNVFGSSVATSISPAMIFVAPDVAYDSWVTIGATSSADDVDGNINVIPGDWIIDFEQGNSFTVNDPIGSGWYIIPPSSVNGISGSDNKVLLTQLTTDGNISGSFRVQVFPDGDQVNDDRVDLTFSQAPLGSYSCPIIVDGPSALTLECSDDLSISSPADFTVYTAEAIGCDPSDITVSLISENITAGSCPNAYTITRVLGITNCTGSTTNFDQTITVIDTTSPVLSIPADYTAECSDAHPMDAASATDNCGEVTIDLVEATTPGACAGDYTITRTFTATDDCGNATSAIFIIYIFYTYFKLLSIQDDFTL